MVAEIIGRWSNAHWSSKNPANKRIAIIGAGAAGLAAAYGLVAVGLNVTIFEQSDKVTK